MWHQQTCFPQSRWNNRVSFFILGHISRENSHHWEGTSHFFLELHQLNFSCCGVLTTQLVSTRTISTVPILSPLQWARFLSERSTTIRSLLTPRNCAASFWGKKSRSRSRTSREQRIQFSTRMCEYGVDRCLIVAWLVFSRQKTFLWWSVLLNPHQFGTFPRVRVWIYLSIQILLVMFALEFLFFPPGWKIIRTKTCRCVYLHDNHLQSDLKFDFKQIPHKYIIFKVPSLFWKTKCLVSRVLSLWKTRIEITRHGGHNEETILTVSGNNDVIIFIVWLGGVSSSTSEWSAQLCQ